MNLLRRTVSNVMLITRRRLREYARIHNDILKENWLEERKRIAIRKNHRAVYEFVSSNCACYLPKSSANSYFRFYHREKKRLMSETSR